MRTYMLPRERLADTAWELELAVSCPDYPPPEWFPPPGEGDDPDAEGGGGNGIVGLFYALLPMVALTVGIVSVYFLAPLAMGVV